MTQGVATLLYKGKGSKATLDSYRPITLLNSDYKLLAKVPATGYPLWACPSAFGGPQSDRCCAWSVNWRQCVVPFRGGGVPAANRSAWMHGFYLFQLGI